MTGPVLPPAAMAPAALPPLIMAESGTDEARFATEAGVVPARQDAAGRITVDMGAPRFRWDEIPLAEPFHDLRAIELQIGPIDNPTLHSPNGRQHRQPPRHLLG